MKLPTNVHKKGPSLHYVKWNNRTKKNEWTRLCAADAPEEILHCELWKIMRKPVDTIGKVMDDYRHTRMIKLAFATQKEYGYILDGRLKDHFGHMRPDDLTSQHVAMYLEMREQEGRGPSGNKEVAVLSSVFHHGMRVGACASNPMYGVRRNKETPRTYYVTDASLRLALRNAPAPLRHLLWVAYLTGMRQRDLMNLTRENLTPEGIKVIQSKDGKHELRLWSHSLRKVVRRGLARSKCRYVFTNRRGEHLTKSAVQCAMRKMKASTSIEWRFHDIRAKADSDHETGLGLMRRYNRARRLQAVK